MKNIEITININLLITFIFITNVLNYYHTKLKIYTEDVLILFNNLYFTVNNYNSIRILMPNKISNYN